MIRSATACKSTIGKRYNYFLHVVYDRQKAGWTLIHSSLPLIHGGGQELIREPKTKREVISIAERIKAPTDCVLIHEDVEIGEYDPKAGHMLYPSERH